MLINNIEVDLEEIGVTFEPNEEQVAALENLAKFLSYDNTAKTATLAGSAGTGKTACTKILLAYLEKSNSPYKITLSTPTHKAKAVLKRLSGDSSNLCTLHSLLNLRPNMDIQEFDAKDIDFLMEESNVFPEFETINLYIVDESGMIPDPLHDFMLERLIGDTGLRHKIIFIGDSKQFRPVGQTELSKVFRNENVFELKKVERVVGDSVIIGPITELRDYPFEVFETIENEHSGLIVYDDPKQFMRVLRDKYKAAVENGITDEVKLICYTNKRVNQFNNAIMKALKMSDALTIDGFYMGNSNYKSPAATSKRSLIYQKYLKPRGFDDPSVSHFKSPAIFNGADYILKYKEPVKISIPQFREMNGFYIEMLDTIENKLVSLYMLDPDEKEINYQDLAFTLESLRLKAINKATPYFVRKNYWKYYFAIDQSFVSLYDLKYENRVVRKADFVPAYAITAHKSQGSSIKEVFIDADNLMVCKSNPEALREAQYVSCSRAKSHIHILQK